MKELLKEIGLLPLNLFLSLLATILHVVLSGKQEKWWKFALAIPFSAVISAYLGPEVSSAVGIKGFSGTLFTVLLAYVMLDFSKNPTAFFKKTIDLKKKWTS